MLDRQLREQLQTLDGDIEHKLGCFLRDLSRGNIDTVEQILSRVDLSDGELVNLRNAYQVAYPGSSNALHTLNTHLFHRLKKKENAVDYIDVPAYCPFLVSRAALTHACVFDENSIQPAASPRQNLIPIPFTVEDMIWATMKSESFRKHTNNPNRSYWTSSAVIVKGLETDPEPQIVKIIPYSQDIAFVDPDTSIDCGIMLISYDSDGQTVGTSYDLVQANSVPISDFKEYRGKRFLESLILRNLLSEETLSELETFAASNRLKVSTYCFTPGRWGNEIIDIIMPFTFSCSHSGDRLDISITARNMSYERDIDYGAICRAALPDASL